MEEWQPISEERIWDKINDAWSRMDFAQRRFWEIVKVLPEKWSNQKRHYDHGSWVVAIIGRMLIWYDDNEEGFCLSIWTKYGVIDSDYSGGEGSLEMRLQEVAFYFDPQLPGPPCEYFR